MKNKNIIVKQIKWFNDEPNKKDEYYIAVPVNETGRTFLNEKKEKAFVFSFNSVYLNEIYPVGKHEDSDPHYRKYTEITEYIETERPETVHPYNGWKLVETKVIQTFQKNGDIKEVKTIEK